MEYLRYAEQIAQLVLLACLIRRGLARCYPMFAAYLAARSVRAICLLSFDYHDAPYARAWALSEPILLVLQVLVVLELTTSILEYYPEIAHLAKVLVGSSLGLGALIGGSAAIVEIGELRSQPLWLASILGAWKWSNLACACALLLQSAWFSIFPMPMRRNVAIHRWMLTLFIGIAPGFSSFFVQLKDIRSADHAVSFQLMLEIVCCIAWTLLLHRSGEQIRYRPDWISREDRGRIHRQYALIIENIRRKISMAQALGESET